MKRASRIAVGAVVTLAMSSAATSVGTDAYAHGVHHHGSHQHRAGVEHDGSFRVLLALGRLDRRLDGAIRHQLTPLTDASGAILRSNAVADRSTVESVATRFSSAPTRRHLDAARSLLRTYHPERYVAASAILRRSGRTTAAIVGLRTLVAPGSLPAAQLSTAADLLAGIRPHRFTARTDRAEMRDVRLELGVAHALVARVRSALAARS